MLQNVVIAGFGGQGILFAGQVLAYAGLFDGKEVLWIPSYGSEMRGGTANCTVIISTDRVRSLLVPNPLGVIAMNRPSLERFEAAIQPGGLLIVNSSLVDAQSPRTDLRTYEVPATGIAEELGAVRVANMVALGAYVGVTGVVSRESILRAIDKVLMEGRADLGSVNATAFSRGVECVVGAPERRAAS